MAPTIRLCKADTVGAKIHALFQDWCVSSAREEKCEEKAQREREIRIQTDAAGIHAAKRETEAETHERNGEAHGRVFGRDVLSSLLIQRDMDE